MADWKSGIRKVLYPAYEARLARRLPTDRLPKHVGVMLDGNRRWAKAVGSEQHPEQGGLAADVLSDIVMFRLNAKHLDVTFSDEELNQMKHAQTAARELIEAMGGVPLTPMPTREEGYGIEAPGRIIHEVGAVRMGNDPKKSALNAYCQAHEAKNVFVADAAPFVSQAHKNTTWTLMALAWRTSDYIAEQRKQGKI